MIIAKFSLEEISVFLNFKQYLLVKVSQTMEVKELEAAFVKFDLLVCSQVKLWNQPFNLVEF